MALESRDISQKLRQTKCLLFLDLKAKIYSYTKKNIWYLASRQNWCFGQFCHSEIEVLKIAEIMAKADTLVIILSA